MDLKKENFLVTGAAGFVAACLTRRLVNQGLKVHALVPLDGDLWRIEDLLPSLTLHRGDITDAAFMQGLIGQVAPSIIYHMAAHGAYPAQNDARRILMTNVLGTFNLLTALDQVPYKLFVNAGSSSEYGFKQKPMEENDIPQPNSDYAVAKVAQTMLCQNTARSKSKPIVIFRLFSVYGPYEEPSRLVPTLVRRCLNHEDLIMASQTTARDFVFIEDVLDAYCAFDRLKDCHGQIINIASGVQLSLKDAVNTAIKVTRSHSQVKWNAMPDRIWDSGIWVGEVSKAKRLLNWQAKTTFEQGLTQTLAWFQQQASRAQAQTA